MTYYTEDQEKNFRYNLEDILLYYIDAKQLDPVIDSILQVFSTDLNEDGGYDQGYEDGYEDGYDEGYHEGKDTGYEEGFEDGKEDRK